MAESLKLFRDGNSNKLRSLQAGMLSVSEPKSNLPIADTGVGIPRDVLPSIFEPFITTKEETGTGLGLWVAAEIMKKNGWSIRVRSSRNPSHRGTAFSIVIPEMHSLSQT